MIDKRPWRVDVSVVEHTCCFSTAVVDSEGSKICEVHDEEEAQLIVDAVNVFDTTDYPKTPTDPEIEALELPTERG